MCIYNVFIYAAPWSFLQKYWQPIVALSIFQISNSDCCQWLIQLQSLCHKAQSVAIHSKGAAREVQMRHLKLEANFHDWMVEFSAKLDGEILKCLLEVKHTFDDLIGAVGRITKKHTTFHMFLLYFKVANKCNNRCKSLALAVINMRKEVWNPKALESLEGTLSGAFPKGYSTFLWGPRVFPCLNSMARTKTWQNFAEMLWFSRNKPRLRDSFQRLNIQNVKVMYGFEVSTVPTVMWCNVHIFFPLLCSTAPASRTPSMMPWCHGLSCKEFNHQACLENLVRIVRLAFGWWMLMGFCCQTSRCWPKIWVEKHVTVANCVKCWPRLVALKSI